MIKYFDNSIFKAIKNYVPARTSVSTGIVIKQHLLERNRRKPVQLSEVTKIAVTPSGGLNTPIVRENLELTSSIKVGSFSGSTGFVNLDEITVNDILSFVTADTGVHETVLGDVPYSDLTQVGFYNGEISGSTITATTQSLLNDPSFDALLNNVSGSRLNSFSMKIEYDQGIKTPSNILQILEGSAERAETPDSNYTSKKIILPRYEGSKVNSANYNQYTPASSSVEFRDGTTGSWSGDSSYGKTAAIDKNPIYFAHFDYSWHNPVIFGMGEYFVDQLIEVPFEDIQGTTIEPKVLKIEGDNSKLQDVVSTFEKNRKLAVTFESEIYEGINYSSLKQGNLKILNPGSKYIITSGNQVSPTLTHPSYSYSRFGEEVGINLIKGTNTTSSILMTTGSGCLNLSGSNPGNIILFRDGGDTVSPSDEWAMGILGPYLSSIHTYNYCLANNIILPPSSSWGGTTDIGVTKGIDPNNKNSYFKLNPSQSGLPNYENDEQPFLIERGDEIRVTYVSSSQYINQNFQVLGVEEQIYSAGSDIAEDYVIYGGTTPYFGSDNDIKVFNKINVCPDPSTLDNKIINGHIYSYTVRKRQDNDSVINVFQNQPSGSKGAETYSGKGYLIPNDLTSTQKRNVQTLITQLKGKNNFISGDN